jgi:hypothetical protein
MAEQGFKVFCLEGQWFEDLEYKASLRGILDLLKSWEVIEDFIFRDVGTTEEFRKFAGLWATDYDDYELAYFASHGSGGHIWLDQDVGLAMSEVAAILEDSCEGRVVHLGGCSTLKTRNAAVDEFLSQTRARAVCGYVRDVDTVEAAALEMLLIEELARKRRVGDGLNAFVKSSAFESIGRDLGFVIWD